MSLIAHDGSLIIQLEMIGHQNVTVFLSRVELEFFIKKNGVHGRWLADWDKSNGFVDDPEGPDGRYIIIGLRDKSRRVVIHECVHAAHHIMDFRGIPISMDNTEIQAYLVDFLCERIFKHLEQSGDETLQSRVNEL